VGGRKPKCQNWPPNETHKALSGTDTTQTSIKTSPAASQAALQPKAATDRRTQTPRETDRQTDRDGRHPYHTHTYAHTVAVGVCESGWPMHDMLRHAEKQLLAHTLHASHQDIQPASRGMAWDGMGCIALCGVG